MSPTTKVRRACSLVRALCAGYVCARDQWQGSGNRCCAEGTSERHVCKKCDVRHRCCKEYEHCVSCCLEPNTKASGGRGVTRWERCLDRCRTTAHSIRGGNRYALTLHKAQRVADTPQARGTAMEYHRFHRPKVLWRMRKLGLPSAQRVVKCFGKLLGAGKVHGSQRTICLAVPL